ncbi:glutathione-dependent formaldehyde-activating protein [Alcanivorax sp. S71-1-4]|uniref:GFA family protein n=1 Tax=Alcanivorax sp. S71-1-4 TaxID=1177159 RepID=UPI001356CB44|nr:GFA family protein [Alcanivorax sp. S71-1-4]KAF0809086.1 glutathione-dependent formaldehyde-activating protein [Alcanivorax sp. S71-1-4]
MSDIRHTGSCLCGGVRYQVTGPLPGIQLCHCGQCRRAQGTPFVTNMPVARSAFTLLSGEDLLQRYESSPGKTRVFCRHCGSPLYSERDTMPDVLRIRAGSLEGDVQAAPAVHIYTVDACNWWPINDELPQYPGSAHAPQTEQ